MKNRRSPRCDMLRLVLLLTTGLLAMATFLLVDEAEADTGPPTDVTVTPVPEGRSLNVSWDPNGTGAHSFQVMLVTGAMNVSLGITPPSEPWFVHRGLDPGESYTYCVLSLSETGEPIGPPSEEVTGVPLHPPSSDGPLSPPSLAPVPEVTNSVSLVVKGMAVMPGSVIEVERIHLQPWTNVSHFLRSSSNTGEFTHVVDLDEGQNLLHARVNDPELGTGIWNYVAYVCLDLQPPEVELKGVRGPFEIGTAVVLDAHKSRDNIGIASFSWSLDDQDNLTFSGPAINFIPARKGPLNITLTVIDIAGNQATMNLTILVEEEDVAPSFVSIPRRIEVIGGKTYVFNVSEWVVDQDDPTTALTYYVSDMNTELYTTGIEGSELILVVTDRTTGQDYLSIRVEDPSGKSDEGLILISVGTGTGWGVGLVSLLIMVFVGLALAFVLYLGAVRRNMAKGDESEGNGPPFFIKSTYLIHMDGRLILDLHSVDEDFKDPDMISGMFTAIQDFIKDSFKTNADLENLNFGKDYLTITRGKHIYLTTVSYNSLDEEYMKTAKSIVRRVEADYSGVLEDWDGRTSSVQGIRRAIEPLHQFNRDRTLEDLMREYNPTVFRAVPSIDFQNGFVKYTVELTNDSDEIIVDPFIDVHWDKEVLHLVKYEPEGARTEGRFRLENLRQGESAQIVLYLDPQACLESFIRGSVTYMDIHGGLHNMVMENVLADINCPMLFTADNANTAMLHRLKDEELEHVDSKSYRFALVLNSKDVFEQAKAAVTSHDIRLVMESVNEDPFIGEAWYYGETKIKDHKVLVRVLVKEDDSTVEYLVASSLKMVITGLLAELGHMFIKKMDERYTSGYNVYRVVRRFVKEDIGRGRPLAEDEVVRELFEHAMRNKTRGLPE